MVLNHSKQVCLGCDFLKPDVRAACRANASRLIYTGPVDRYFAGSAAAQARATIIAPLYIENTYRVLLCLFLTPTYRVSVHSSTARSASSSRWR